MITWFCWFLPGSCPGVIPAIASPSVCLSAERCRNKNIKIHKHASYTRDCPSPWILRIAHSDRGPTRSCWCCINAVFTAESRLFISPWQLSGSEMWAAVQLPLRTCGCAHGAKQILYVRMFPPTERCEARSSHSCLQIQLKLCRF